MVLSLLQVSLGSEGQQFMGLFDLDNPGESQLWCHVMSCDVM